MLVLYRFAELARDQTTLDRYASCANLCLVQAWSVFVASYSSCKFFRTYEYFTLVSPSLSNYRLDIFWNLDGLVDTTFKPSLRVKKKEQSRAPGMWTLTLIM